MYKRQEQTLAAYQAWAKAAPDDPDPRLLVGILYSQQQKFQDALTCLLYTSDAADERSSVDLGGRRIIKKKIIVTDVNE